MKRILTIQKKVPDGGWTIVSQTYCEPQDVRQLIHTVSTDANTRVRAAKLLTQNIPVYNFCPTGTMTKLER